MDRRFGQLRLVEGVERIEAWSRTATQVERNGVHEMLFAVAGSALLRAYPVVDGEQPGAITVLVRQDVAVCLSFPEPGAFGVQAIGHPCAIVPQGSGSV